MANQDDDFYVKRTFALPRTSKLTEEMIQQLDHIFDFAPPEEYRNTLIEIYHTYLIHEHDGFPINFDEMSGHMYFLIDFFRRVLEEMSVGGEPVVAKVEPKAL
jgi:hypothetical protein